MAPPAKREKKGWWRVPLQLVASAAVFWVLLRDTDLSKVGAALGQAHMGWLVLAVAMKTLSLALHEVRLWITMRAYDPDIPAKPVIEIGFVSGLMNMVLPVRGGDLLAMALMKREVKVESGVAVAGVGLTAFFEAAVFGVFLLGVLLVGAAQWEELLGAASAMKAKGTLTLMTLGAVFGSAVLVVVGRKLATPEGDDGPKRPGMVELVRSTLVRTSEGLTEWSSLAANVGISVIQVALVVASFWALLPALGLDVEFPIMAACGLIAMGSLASIVLPPGLAAGQAATAVFVLGFFGVSESDAIAYTALSWVANSFPPVLCGIVPTLKRIKRLPELIRGEATDVE